MSLSLAEMEKEKDRLRRRRIIRENTTAAVYLIPAFLFILTFMAYPLFYSGYISFFKWNGISKKVFTGFDNFIRIAQDEFFWRSLSNNVFIAAAAIVFQVFLAMVIAYILVRITKRVKRVYMFLYLVPMVVSEICIGLLWGFIYNPYFGLLNGFFRTIGLESLALGWLGESATAFPAVINTMNFTYLGLYVLLFVNAIQNVPDTVFDAATVDGAGRGRTLFSIVIPMMWSSIVSTMLLCVISSFKTFSLVFVLTSGGPNHASEVLSTYLYKMGFNSFQMGYGATIGFIQMVLTALAGILIIRIMNRSKASQAFA